MRPSATAVAPWGIKLTVAPAAESIVPTVGMLPAVAWEDVASHWATSSMVDWWSVAPRCRDVAMSSAASFMACGPVAATSSMKLVPSSASTRSGLLDFGKIEVFFGGQEKIQLRWSKIRTKPKSEVNEFGSMLEM